MRFTELFTKVLRAEPKDEVSINAKLLVRAGFVRKVMAGVYAYMPLGLRVLDKIKKIIKEEMEAIGGQEVQFSSFQPKELWEKTGRWDLLGDKEKLMYQFEAHGGTTVGLAATHEEPATDFAKDFIHSYKDLPKSVYQFQKKFRDEARPKSGLVRLREFLMKDLYSFHADENDLNKYYETVKKAYEKIFKRTGLNAFAIEASGGIFTKNISHEFQVLNPYGEDKILYCSKCQWAQNKEVAKAGEGDPCPKCSNVLSWVTGVEVGNIFNNGTKYSKDLDLYYKDKKGERSLVWMGSYGIGLDRLMGTLADVSNDQKGIVWPETVAPYQVHLISLKNGESEAEKVYEVLKRDNIEVLFDDRDEVSAGEKFAEADLIGIPWRIVVSEKLVKEEKVEMKKRNQEKIAVVSLKEALKKIH